MSPRQQLIADVEQRVKVVAPWTVNEFREWLASYLNRKVIVQPYARGERRPTTLAAGQCGLVVVTPASATIWYDPSRSERHQRAQIFHEFAHLLLGHHVEFPLIDALRSGEHPLASGFDPALLAAAFGDPRPTRSEGRSAEAEAELVGTKLAVQSVGPIEISAGPERNSHCHRLIATWARPL